MLHEQDVEMAAREQEADEEDQDMRKVPDVVCSLSLSDVHSEILLRTKTVVEEDKNKNQRLVLQAAQLLGLAPCDAGQLPTQLPDP